MDIDKHTIEVIVNQFGLKKVQDQNIEAFDFGLKDLEMLLSARIKYLIDYDRNKLMTTLYRIDINEDAVKNIFKHSKAELIPVRIAKLIISRAAEKIKNYKI
jgi:signal transduction histidine kinase